MIIKTPLRLSLAGGGSDLSYFYRKHEGSSIGFPIKFYNYIHISNLDSKLIKFVSDKENIETHDYKTIKNDILRNVISKYKINQKKIFVFSDLPYGTGLGSSSAMSVGLVKGISIIKNLQFNDNEIANIAYEIEKKSSGSTIGKQDHYMSSFGGMNLFTYKKDETTKVQKIKLSNIDIANIEKNLLLIRVGGIRNASEILHDQKNNLIHNEKKFHNMKLLVSFVPLVKNSIKNANFKELGRLISETWELKKTFSKYISNNEVEKLYDYLKSYGIYGGKLLGAGQSGFFLVICNPKVRKKIINSLPNDKILNFNLDQKGSRIIFD